MACTTGCPTQDHRSYGECLRSKHIATTGLESTGNGIPSREKERTWDAELSAYVDAKKQGIQPAGTDMASIRQALDLSDATGTAYQADA